MLELQLYIISYIFLYTYVIGGLLLLLYHIGNNTQYVLQYHYQYTYYSKYILYLVCALILITAGIPPFSFFFIKVIYCKYILLYTNFIYFIYFIYFTLFMLYFYLKFIQLFFPKNILLKNFASVNKLKMSYSIKKNIIFLIYIMLGFFIYINDYFLLITYILA